MKSASYPDHISLSRRLGGVEKALAYAAALIPAFLLGVGLATARADGTEPNPWPDTDLPSNSDYHQAETFLAKHQWAEAVTVLRPIVSRDHRSIPAVLGLARALTYMGRRDDGLAALSDVIAHEKGARRATLIRKFRVMSRVFLTNATFQLYQDGVNLLRFHKFKPARDRFEHALAQESNNVEILIRIGQCLVLENNNNAAADRLIAARKLNPFEPEIHLWLGRAMHERGEMLEALSELRSAKADMKDWELPSIWLADALYASGQRQTAVQTLEDDVKAHPLHVSTLYSLAEFRLATLPKDKSAKDNKDKLWQIRQDLQIALSRLPQYDLAQSSAPTVEFDVELRKPDEELKADLQKMMQKVDAQIAATPERS